MPCEKCNKIRVQKCDDELCQIEIDASCVKVKALPCIGTSNNAKLSNVLIEIDERLCDLNPTVHTYSINSVCYLQEEGDAPHAIQVLLTPNFTHTTPISISFATLDSTFNIMITNVFHIVVNSVTSGTPITLTYPVLGFNSIIDVDGGFTFRVIDNLGNYSNEFVIADGDLNKCETP